MEGKRAGIHGAVRVDAEVGAPGMAARTPAARVVLCQIRALHPVGGVVAPAGGVTVALRRKQQAPVAAREIGQAKAKAPDRLVLVLDACGFVPEIRCARAYDVHRQAEVLSLAE